MATKTWVIERAFEDAPPVAFVEASGKLAALAVAQRSLGGQIQTSGDFARRLHAYGESYTARPARRGET